MARATEDQFIGALLGLAIGDALGRPLIGLTPEQVAETYGAITGFVGEDAEREGAPTGVITDETEVTLCIVESLTTNDGMIDAENINTRLGFLLRGDSRRWLPESVIAGIERAEATDGLVLADADEAAELSVAVRGVPVGLLHAVDIDDDFSLEADARTVTRFSHGGNRQAALTATVARAFRAAARDEAMPMPMPMPESPVPGSAEAYLGVLVAEGFASPRFEDALFARVAQGADADTAGAIVGAIAGARFGASGIPQHLIDELDARMYLSLAAPLFYRTARRRRGTVIDLRKVD
ncbi:MAG: ADP-ribosylglycohydrolase family protein [Thermomicrobiales bacterium]